MKKNRSFYVKIIISVIFLCISSFFFLIKFQTDMEKREDEVLRNDVQKYVEFGAIIVERTLEGYITSLSGIAEPLGEGLLQTDEQMEYLKGILDSHAFVRLGISDLEGNLRVTDGVRTDIEIDISDCSYFSEVINEKHYVVTEIEKSRVTGKRVFMVSGPIFNPDKDVVGVLHGAIRLEDFHPYGDNDIHYQNLYIQVIDKNGNYIVSNQDKHLPGDNSSFDGLRISKGDVPANEIIEMIRQGKSIVTKRNYGDVDYTVYFEPLKLNSWYMVVAVNDTYIAERVDSFMKTMVYPLIIKILCILILLYVLVLFYIRRSERQKLRKEEKLRKQLLAGVEGFMVIDLQADKILRCSEALIAPYSKKISYSNLLEFWKDSLIAPEYAQKTADKMSISSIVERFKAGVDTETIEYPIQNADGAMIWRECVIMVKEEDSYLMAYSIYRNISSKKQTELLLKEKAERDYLTGLYNRSYCVEVVNQLIQSGKLQDNRKQVFVLIDLDNFKSINDNLGHQIGDKALQDVANILIHHFREYDVVCRLAGDEFVVLLKNIPAKTVERNIAVLLNKLQLTYTENLQSVSITASIGISFISEHGVTFEEVYTKADKALYLSKERGKNKFYIYSEEYKK